MSDLSCAYMLEKSKPRQFCRHRRKISGDVCTTGTTVKAAERGIITINSTRVSLYHENAKDSLKENYSARNGNLIDYSVHVDFSLHSDSVAVDVMEGTMISAAATPNSHSQQVNEKVSTPTQNGEEKSLSQSSSRGKKIPGRRANLASANHLLNFHYDPISRSQSSSSSRYSHPVRRHRKTKPYNKDLFLQANYKFVVLDSGSFYNAPELPDPDKMLNWDDIICLRYSTPTEVYCPICLDSPLCPQITSCGHIFCFPCILRYLLMGKEDDRGESWKKCPLCFVMISPKDLYTIFIETVREYNVGDRVEFSLLTRQKDSNSLSLKNKLNKEVSGDSYDPFSKFTFTSDVDLPMRRATADLDGWLVKADSGLVDDLEKLPYVCAALEQLEQRKKYWDEHRARDSNNKSADRSSSVNINHGKSKVSDYGVRELSREFDDSDKWLGTCSDHSVDATEMLENQDNVLSSSYEETNVAHRNITGAVEVKEKDSYNFYQAADGQLIILHPLNTKCLLHHFGSYNLLPDRISGKILQLETVVQSEAIRRRYKFLSHFSLTTTFQLCEIDLSDSLPHDSLLPFMDEIMKREKQRKQAARKERKDKIKAEAALESPMPALASFQPSFRDESPVFTMDDFEALGTSTSRSPPLVVGERKLFSSITRLGFASAHDSPVLKIEESSSQNDNQARSNSSGNTGSSNGGTMSFASVISRAKAVESLEEPKVNNLGKKGKKPSRVLLSTAGGRRY